MLKRTTSSMDVSICTGDHIADAGRVQSTCMSTARLHHTTPSMGGVHFRRIDARCISGHVSVWVEGRSSHRREI